MRLLLLPVVGLQKTPDRIAELTISVDVFGRHAPSLGLTTSVELMLGGVVVILKNFTNRTVTRTTSLQTPWRKYVTIESSDSYLSFGYGLVRNFFIWNPKMFVGVVIMRIKCTAK